nr:GNAT family N-acetyltransferase [uncultured Oscillibacter sp.]
MDEKLLHDAHDIFCEVFHSKISYETFRHKHLDNPDIDAGVATLVDYQDGVPAGTNSFMGYTLLDGPRALPVVHSCDTAVRPAFRGRRIFLLLVQRAISVCQETPNVLIYATPNENSYPGFTKLGFLELGRLKSYDGVLQPARFFLRRVRRKLLGKAPALAAFRPGSFSGPGGSWILSSGCPFTEDDLALINARPGVHLRRSLDFYRWKVDYLPEERRAYLCVRRGGALRAFFILRRNCDGAADHCCCDICDWMLPEDEEAAREIFRAAVRHLRPYCDRLSVSMVNPETEGPVISSGLPETANQGQPFMIYPTAELDAETLSRLKHFRSWTLRYIDTDTILHG